MIVVEEFNIYNNVIGTKQNIILATYIYIYILIFITKLLHLILSIIDPISTKVFL